MRNPIKVAAAAMLAFSLVTPLAACGGGQAPQAPQTSEEQVQAVEQAVVDAKSWKTVGDALAAKTEDYYSASWDDRHFLMVFDAGDSTYRVVAKMDAKVEDQLSALNAEDEDYDQQFDKAVGPLSVLSTEDITGDKISQDKLDAYVGKTGQDLMNDGFTFVDYNMYGDDESGAEMDKGFFTYDVTFAATVTEDQIEDEGDAIKDATIVAIECIDCSSAAVDPTTVK